jgi:HK97 family phage major capsid protein
MRKFELPESLKESKDADALLKVGQAIADMLGEADKETIDQRIDEKLKELRENGATKETVDALEKALKKQGSAITELKERGVPTGKGSDFSEQLKSFMTTGDFKSAMKSGKSTTFEFKADPTTITATNFASAQPWALSHEVEPGIGVAPKEANVIFPLLNKGTTNSRDIYWVNRGPVNGDANFIGEGALKPLVDWTYNNATSNAKKVAAATKVSTEMLDDFAYMQAEIREVLNDVVMTHTDAELLNGAGTGDDLKGILTDASAYVGTDLDGDVPFANLIDAIRAIVLQMRTLNQRPNVVILNPADKAAVDLLKNDNGNYISAEALAIIRSLTIVETTEIEAGKVVVLDTSKFKVRPYKGISITFGWENDDFRKNLVTVICEMRLHSYHNSIDDSAIVYDTISTITAALNKADA